MYMSAEQELFQVGEKEKGEVICIFCRWYLPNLGTTLKKRWSLVR